MIMARPFGLECPVESIMALFRGNTRLPIFKEDRDRYRFLAILQEVVERFKGILFLHFKYMDVVYRK